MKAQAPSRTVLTAQLYFPGEARNASDGIYREECLISSSQSADGVAGRFNFVLDLP